MTVIRLSMPPTANNLFAGRGKSRYRTREYDVWRETAGWELARQRPPLFLGAVSVVIEVSLAESTDSWDVCNREKATMDLLVTHRIIQGDNRPYVREVTMRWADVDGVRVIITPQS